MTYVLAFAAVALFLMIMGLDTKLRKQAELLRALTAHIATDRYDGAIDLRYQSGVWQ